MSAALALIATLTLASAAVALSLRNIIRSVLLLVLAWFGIAAFYLWTGAEFAAFAQVLVYGGAVSMVVLFAVLLSRRQGDSAAGPAAPIRPAAAIGVGAAVAALLIWTACDSRTAAALGAGRRAMAAPDVPVRQLGKLLLGTHAAALLVMGAVLTVALLGGIILAASTGGEGNREDSP